MARKHATGLIFVVLLLVACDKSPATFDIVGPEVIVGSDCANEPAATSDTSRAGEVVSGDMDGDGKDDSIEVVLDPAGDSGCKSFLVVRTADITYSTPVDPSGAPRSLQAPSLSSLAEVNGEPGLEAIVNIETGASTQFVAAFTLTARHLEQITVEGKGPGPFADAGEDLFAFGGSVGHIEGVDCASNGMVQMLAAVPVGDTAETYRVEHRFFRPDGAQLIVDQTLDVTEKLSATELADLPGFTSSPFGSCD